MDNKNNSKKSYSKKNVQSVKKSNEKNNKFKAKSVGNLSEAEKKKRNLTIAITSACLVVVVFLAIFLPIFLLKFLL